MINLYADTIERRERIMIYSDLLKVSIKPKKITKILRLANLQYNTFKDSLPKLCNAGLLEKMDSDGRDKRTGNNYQTTELGKGWIKRLEQIYIDLGELYTHTEGNI